MPSPRGNALPTRLRLLWELHREPQTRLRPLAKRLDITNQAVSSWLRRLGEEHLVERKDGTWKPTKAGTVRLLDSMKDLRMFLDESLERMRLIDETYALADSDLEADARVTLYMRDGRLNAGNRRTGGSRGRVREAARRGQLVLVGDLEGILPMTPAPITILLHPDGLDATVLARAREKTRGWLDQDPPPIVAVHALTSFAWAQALGWEPRIEFSPVAAAQDASFRGVPVLYLAPRMERVAVEAQLRASPGPAAPIRSVDL